MKKLQENGRSDRNVLKMIGCVVNASPYMMILELCQVNLKVPTVKNIIKLSLLVYHTFYLGIFRTRFPNFTFSEPFTQVYLRNHRVEIEDQAVDAEKLATLTHSITPEPINGMNNFLY